jgi:hypothetical protein
MRRKRTRTSAAIFTTGIVILNFEYERQAL